MTLQQSTMPVMEGLIPKGHVYTSPWFKLKFLSRGRKTLLCWDSATPQSSPWAFLLFCICCHCWILAGSVSAQNRIRSSLSFWPTFGVRLISRYCSNWLKGGHGGSPSPLGSLGGRNE